MRDSIGTSAWMMYMPGKFKNGKFRIWKTHTETRRRKQDHKVTALSKNARFLVSDSTAFSPSVRVVALALDAGRILVLVAALASGGILVLVPTLAAPCGISTKWHLEYC